jgi:hypothetical protein
LNSTDGFVIKTFMGERVNWTRFLKNASLFLAMGFRVCSQEKRKQNASKGGKSGLSIEKDLEPCKKMFLTSKFSYLFFCQPHP